MKKEWVESIFDARVTGHKDNNFSLPRDAIA